MTEGPPSGGGRRDFLGKLVVMAGVAPLAAREAIAKPAPPAPTAAGGGAPAAQPVAPAAPATAPVVYVSLGANEAAFVEAMVNVLCPADGLTPSGVDCGLATFIDRQLAGPFGRGARLYSKGPWHHGKPQLGYQSPLTPEQFFKEGIRVVSELCKRRFDCFFDELTATQIDGLLKEIAAGKADKESERLPLSAWFNEVVYPLFVQGCFADPIYGGNRDKVFWRMIGYPGLPAMHSVDIVKFRGKPYPGAKNPKSIADFS